MFCNTPLLPQREASASALGAALLAHHPLVEDDDPGFARSLFASVSASSLITATLTSTPIVALRGYQSELVERLRISVRSGHRAPLLAVPTGGGKTVVFAGLCASALAKGRRTLVVVHRRELYRQAVRKLKDVGVDAGVIAVGVPEKLEQLVQVGSIQTLVRRLDKLPAFDVIILDEARHARDGQWGQLLSTQPRAIIVGVTATPARLDGKGLGKAAGGIFDDLIVGPSIADLARDGHLSPAKCFVPEHRLNLRGVRVRCGDYAIDDLSRAMCDNGITGDAVEQYRLRADHQAAIAFCVSVAHAEAVAQSFRDAGYRARCVHGDMPKDQRDAAIAGLGDGSVEVLTSCDLISEGLDVPAVGAVILLRPTKSLVLYMQQVGRGMRPAPGKDALIVLDHAGNVLQHGLPDDERQWSLDGVPAKPPTRQGAMESPVWRCDCGCVNPIRETACAECGEPKPAGRDMQAIPGQLAEVTADMLRAMRSMSFFEMKSRPRSEAELREFARSRRYRPGWVGHFMREQRLRFSQTESLA